MNGYTKKFIAAVITAFFIGWVTWVSTKTVAYQSIIGQGYSAENGGRLEEKIFAIQASYAEIKDDLRRIEDKVDDVLQRQK